ncbi:MOSC domain-containing protein [Calothrix rhizosoleniae]|uniref:MOSC domain-containing protein n=1 Tax=Calothrix rhizosoleniae TaxID=888997 RepID=UPI000B4A1628|nr:MOSC N-terminal beta barrel domain-containing protein [Calothrix rhizosoleniae]
MPYLAKILLYPIKSLDGVEVSQTQILPSGALKCDRKFAIFDPQNKFVNGKRNPKIHLLRSHFNLDKQTVSLQIPHIGTKDFHLDLDRESLTKAFSDFFGMTVRIKDNPVMGFPDDTKSPGPTIISTATLTEVASWFPGMSVEQLRRRIRANLEIDDVPAFWEDRLFTDTGNTISLRIGDTLFLGVNPCQRCIVPVRNPETGQAYEHFQKIFVSQRQKTLPPWVNKSRFNHFYKLSVNTRISPLTPSHVLSVGDRIEIISSAKTDYL